MPTKRVTRASTRAAQATAANPPAHLANPIAPIPAPVAANAPQPAPTGGASPRRTRSGKIIGMVKTVATKLTRARRAPKAAPIQETVREVDDHVGVAPTTEPATVPPPPAPPRKRGGKAVKKDKNEVQIAVNDAAASSSNAAPAPAATKRSVKRTKSTRSLPSKDKGKARELPIEEAEAPEPAAVPAHVPPAPADASPKPPKPVEDIERITADIRTLNATLLANDQIAWVDHTYVSHVYENSTLNYVNVPKAAERLVRRAHAEARQATRSRANGPSQTTVPAGARNQGKQNGHRQPPVASTPATAPSTPEPEPQPEVKPAPLKREAAVNWGYPEYYKERVRKAQEAGGSTSPTALDYPTADERASVASSSSTMPPPAASTSQPITTNGAAPSGNGNAAAASGDSETLPRGRLQRWNAVILGYPDGYTPRNPWPASAIDPTGLTSHPDVVRDESGAIVLPPHLLTARTAALAASVAPPQPPVTPSQPTHATSRSPPPSSSSNESADLAEVEASISIHVDDGDAHPAADLLSPSTQAPLNSTPPASTSSPASTVPRHAPLTRQHAVIFDSRGREIPTHHEDDDAVVQQVIAHVLREVEAERAARPVPLSSSASASVSAPHVPITRTEAPPVRASAGMSLFAPAAKSNAKGKGKAPANCVLNGNAKGKEKAQGEAAAKTNARPSNSIFGPKPEKGKKRAREPEPTPEPAPAPQLWGYTSSTGPMKVRVSLVPVVLSPKRQRVSESAADGGVASAEAPAVAGVQDESAPTEEENHTLPTATHQGAKRSREEFEEGSSRADTDGEDEDEGEARPAKKLRTRSQQGGES